MDDLDEKVLDITQRQKRAQIMRRYKAKIERSREMAQKRLAPEKNIKKRAYAQARQIVRKRFAGKRGAEYEKLGPSEKMSIDRAIEKKAGLIKKIALRLIPRVKSAEAKRLQSFHQGQQLKNHGAEEGHKPVNEQLNSLFAEKFDGTSTNQLPDENKPDAKAKGDKQSAVKKKAKTGDIIIYNKFGEEVLVSRPVFEGLTKKAEKSGIDIETLGEVYDRGRDAWNDNGKVTKEQYAFARVNSFINQGRSYFEEDADLHGEELVEKRGLWDNIHAKRKRIKAGSGERMRKPGSKGAPTSQNFKDAQESFEIDEGTDKNHPIVKEYDSLKKHDIKTLRGMISQHHKVIDTSEFKTKDHAVSHLLRQKHGNKKVDHAFGLNEEVLDEAKKFGTHIGTVNGYHIHDLGANTPHKEKRFLAYHNSYGFISHSAPTKTEITKKSKERDKSETPKPRTDHDDWRDEQKHRISSGEVRRAVMSRRGVKEEVEVEESNNTPYVRPHIEKGSTKPSGWKASNKHGRVKYFGLDFKKSAEKHAGISEAMACGDDSTDNAEIASGTKKRRKEGTVVGRPDTKPSKMGKQKELKDKILDEEGNSQNDPAKREVGTDSVVKAFKKDTPGQDPILNESFNIAYSAGVGVTLTAADLGMKVKSGFELHPSVIEELKKLEAEEESE